MWTRSNWPRSLHSRTTRYKRDKFDFWESVYGFDMTAVRTLALGEPLVDEVYAEQVRDHAEITLEIVASSHLGDVSQVCSTRSRVLEIDLATATPADLRFSSKFALKATRQVALDCPPPPPARATTATSVHVAGFRPRDRRLLRHLILRVPQDGGTVD